MCAYWCLHCVQGLTSRVCVLQRRGDTAQSPVPICPLPLRCRCWWGRRPIATPAGQNSRTTCTLTLSTPCDTMAYNGQTSSKNLLQGQQEGTSNNGSSRKGGQSTALTAMQHVYARKPTVPSLGPLPLHCQQPMLGSVRKNQVRGFACA